MFLFFCTPYILLFCCACDASMQNASKGLNSSYKKGFFNSQRYFCTTAQKLNTALFSTMNKHTWVYEYTYACAGATSEHTMHGHWLECVSFLYLRWKLQGWIYVRGCYAHDRKGEDSSQVSHAHVGVKLQSGRIILRIITLLLLNL